VQYGLPVTAERLRQIEGGEAFLRSLGIAGDLRVRHHGETARIEAAPDQLPRLRAAWGAVQGAFSGLGFSDVVLDPRGYRRGSLLAMVAGAER
jgi:uncharacterized protein